MRGYVGMRSECRTISPVLPALLVAAHDLAFELNEPRRLQPTDKHAAQRSRRRKHAPNVRMGREGRIVERQRQRAL